ncbi:MAG: hypothetical protein R2838_24335 [Caldilineaceae bacterium]
MQLIEVVVNIPIRRTYARYEHPPHDVVDEPSAEDQPRPPRPSIIISHRHWKDGLSQGIWSGFPLAGSRYRA